MKGGNPENRSKYYLNDVATAKKLKKGAIANDITKVCNKDSSHTIKISTGSYISTVLPLLKFWMEMREIDETDMDGMKVEVENVITKKDKGGTVEGYIVKLIVEGEEVTITLWDMALKMLVQGGPQQIEFTTRALIPYLENEIDACQKDMKKRNDKVLQLAKHGSCNVCAKTFNDTASLKKHMINHQISQPLSPNMNQKIFLP